ncbi:hypothetical protein E1A91_D04G068700v1 [Gossypium mustelinum]|uniref:Uncharacterized protein n=3 Tax=Gossypium TaxID=3633 RepID=A0A5D2VAU6_GOSMU|nr:hypothetical protein ES288_D04G070500v1 [Gossypium darwinii]TYH76242.1 hypothetical protein ES332_D04G071200v1 [Gossypium tomentosum]TYI86505.1 hypothetical protein E1A91_D04G068700v1 [Gossypium mustelinum]
MQGWCADSCDPCYFEAIKYQVGQLLKFLKCFIIYHVGGLFPRNKELNYVKFISVWQWIKTGKSYGHTSYSCLMQDGGAVCYDTCFFGVIKYQLALLNITLTPVLKGSEALFVLSFILVDW